MQRLTDDGATQKLPSSGVNTETAQGDDLPPVMFPPPSTLPCMVPAKRIVTHFPPLSLSVCFLSRPCRSPASPCCTIIVQRNEVCKFGSGLSVSSAVG